MFDNDKLLFSAQNEVCKVKAIVEKYESFKSGGEAGSAKREFQNIVE